MVHIHDIEEEDENGENHNGDGEVPLSTGCTCALASGDLKTPLLGVHNGQATLVHLIRVQCTEEANTPRVFPMDKCTKDTLGTSSRDVEIKEEKERYEHNG